MRAAVACSARCCVPRIGGRARVGYQMRLHHVAGSESAEGAWSALGFTVVEQVRVRDLDGGSG